MRKTQKQLKAELRDDSFRQQVLAILDENSGGVKYTQLVKGFVSWYYRHDPKAESLDFTQCLLPICKSMPEVEVLEYAQFKYFVYRRLPSHDHQKRTAEESRVHPEASCGVLEKSRGDS